MIFTYAQTAGKVNQKVTCAIDNIELHDCVGTTTPKERKCDFEDGWCTWKNNNTSNNHLAWMLGGEYFKTTLLRPNHDHTYGNGTGSYLFLSNFERNTGEKADLIGEVLFSSDSRTQCVEFWYDINGDKDTTLQVLAVDTTDQSRKASLLWTQKGSDKSSWLMGQLAPPQYSRVQCLDPYLPLIFMKAQ
nr:MAM and LDL-receptor class A domain-containing protein 1-like [Rhipicephalus microplus]